MSYDIFNPIFEPTNFIADSVCALGFEKGGIMPAVFCTREGHDDDVYLTAATTEELVRKVSQHAAEMSSRPHRGGGRDHGAGRCVIRGDHGAYEATGTVTRRPSLWKPGEKRAKSGFLSQEPSGRNRPF
jgi:hypothetical protein